MTSPNLLRRYWPAVAILAIVAVTACVFVRGGHDEQLRARVGQTFEAVYTIADADDDDEMSVDTTSLRIPSGEIDIFTTAPQRSMPTGSTFEDRLAPEGGSLIGVQVRTNPGKTLPLPELDDYATPAMRVALEVGSRSYPVPSTLLSATTDTPLDRLAWVAVAGTPDEVRIAITYDGVTQRVNPGTGARKTGAASPLYRLPLLTSINRRQPTACGTPAVISDRFRSRSFDDLRCAVTTIGALPYLPGRGWAEPGTTWFSVAISLDRYIRFERDGRTYRVNTSRVPEIAAAPSTSATLTAVPPLRRGASLPVGAGGRLAVFSVPTGTAPPLTLTATFRDLTTYIEQPSRSVAQGPSVRLTWKVMP